MSADKLTDEQATEIGNQLRQAEEGNLLVGSFAAEMVRESYPFSKAMSVIVFQDITASDLGRRFAAWCDKNEPPST